MGKWFKRWLRRCLAFFRPLEGWKERLSLFQGGTATWDVPGNPAANKVIPWPLQWVPHKLHSAENPPTDDAALARGFDFVHPTVCVDSGRSLALGVGVRCVRCAVDLHPALAGQRTGSDPPSCRRCRILVSRV